MRNYRILRHSRRDTRIEPENSEGRLAAGPRRSEG